MSARFNLVLSDDLVRDIDKAALASFSNKSEVLRKALQLYLAACEAKSRGLKIGFFEPDAGKLQTEVVGL